METYYQESGRAGRDGLPSECLLYFRPGDVPRQSSMVFYENSGLQNLYDMVRYCQSKRNCRRKAFFRHFGESPQDCNGMCDNCTDGSNLKELDVTSHAKIIVSLLRDIQENDQRATLLQLLEKFKVKKKELGTSSRPVSDLKKEEFEQLIVQLILDRVLKEEFQHTAYSTNAYVTIGPLWKQTLEGRKLIKLEICSGEHSSRGRLKAGKRSQTSDLEIKLDKLRKELASSHGGIFPHAVLSTQQISTLSTQKPASIAELEKLIGKVKSEKYGSRIIGLIQQDIEGEQPSSIAKGDENRGNKKRRKNKALVLDSSEDE